MRLGVFGHATVTGTEDVIVNGTRVAAFVIDRTETFKLTQLDESGSDGTLLIVEIDNSREWQSPEYGLLLKSHAMSDVTDTLKSKHYVLTDDLTLDNISPS